VTATHTGAVLIGSRRRLIDLRTAIACLVNDSNERCHLFTRTKTADQMNTANAQESHLQSTRREETTVLDHIYSRLATCRAPSVSMRRPWSPWGGENSEATTPPADPRKFQISTDWLTGLRIWRRSRLQYLATPAPTR
jgi:hypothetical protein